ncbi:MAG: hypothetical protein GXO78_09815 [Calditrichaeota bacterium]|nr:hypothetical protein [Calditrichota bacterium]
MEGNETRGPADSACPQGFALTMTRLTPFIRLFLLIGLFLLGIFGCNKRVTNGDLPVTPEDGEKSRIPAFGSDQTFEIATWNIQNFPKAGENTLKLLAEIIQSLNIDVYAVQEIQDTVAFRQLLQRLPDYEGIYSADTYSSWYQKTGVIYKKQLVTLADKKQLYWNDRFSFPRPPLQVYVTADFGTVDFDFYLIVLHLKAFSGAENEDRRRSAVQKLKKYVEDQIAAGADPDFILAGDWNDELTDEDLHNVFLPFLNNPEQFIFLTLPLAKNGEVSYYVGNYRSLIDHILITTSIQQAYPNIETQIIKLDQLLSNFYQDVSDHRPVAARIPIVQ